MTQAFNNNTKAIVTGNIITNTSDFIVDYTCDMIDANTNMTNQQKTEAKNSIINNPPKNNPLFYTLTQNTIHELFLCIVNELTSYGFVSVNGNSYPIQLS